jgi:hypothetical protein
MDEAQLIESHRWALRDWLGDSGAIHLLKNGGRFAALAAIGSLFDFAHAGDERAEFIVALILGADETMDVEGLRPAPTGESRLSREGHL